MSMLYPLYYKQFGIRRVQNMVTPNLFDLSDLPRNSFIHYATNDVTHKDVDTSAIYFKNTNKRIMLDVPEFYDQSFQALGNPKRKNILVKPLLRDFLVDNKQFKYLKDQYKLINDPLTLFVNNYNYLNEIYRYVEVPMSSYFRWFNTQRTIWSTINDISASTDRNNFIVVDAPLIIPSYSLLNTYSVKTNTTLVKIFDTPEKLFVLELWKWLNPETRKDSSMGVLNDRYLGKINIIINTPNGKSCLLNLGYLNSWIKDNENLTEFSNISQFNFDKIQLLLLRLILTLQSNIPEEIIQDEETEIAKDAVKSVDNKEETDESTDEDQGDNDEEENISTPVSGIVAIKTDKFLTDELADQSKDVEEKDIVDSTSTFDFAKQFADINTDIKLLESISKRQLVNKGIILDSNGDELEKEFTPKKEITVSEAKDSIYKDIPAYKTIKEIIDTEADFGSISASDYKKSLKDLEAYQVMKDPYGSNQSVTQLSIIDPSELKIDIKKTTIADVTNISDKSALTSSLLSFDSDYIDKIMKKDILSMIGGLQKAGVIIKSHEIELDNSALGTYENHTLELKPVNGVNSIVRFRIPKVNEDGTFFANGNKYIMRKQRIDKPIRKIDPTTVALTSYYGKTFVNLDDKKANNSVEWIAKQVNKASMDVENYIIKVDPANVFDNKFVAPYIYNALANKYKLIQTKEYTLLFDHIERSKLFSGDLLRQAEVNGSRIIGYNNNRVPLVIDIHNEISLYKSSESVTPIGNIYDVLGLPEQKAPTDFTTVRIFSKTVPIVIVLGYLIGISKLLKSLEVNYRVVENKSLMQLQKHEYAITFKDEIYIFSKKDKVSSLIISGLLEFEKELKNYTFEQLDHKDVYFVLLKSKGLGSIYVREIDLLDKLFVDTITKDILIEMNQPVTFRGLLIRATEMLTQYHHPSSQDLDSMRIRGYERISGVIYKELAAAIRQHQNKNISNKSKIDISPFQIWSKIMKDPAIKLVEDTNPIQNLKESEIVTYVGEGGRGKDSMNKQSRAFQPSDMGVISEATVDSSDVGINAYLSANPAFSSLRGTTIKNKDLTSASLLSTSALLGSFSTSDD